MRCIFCKAESSYTKGLEHVIPESLGNIEFVLPKGTVCDKCNSYFAVKIEKPMLDLPYFRNLRHRNRIPNKKRRVPSEKGLILHPEEFGVDINIEHNEVVLNVDNPNIIEFISDGKSKCLILPIITEPEKNDILISRFLAKTSLEALAYYVNEIEGWNDEIISKIELDQIRNYARYGKGEFWNYHQRRVYSEGKTLNDQKNCDETYEILNEFGFFFIDEVYLYFVLVIMGVEYVIGMGGTDINGYVDWLLKNKGAFPINMEGKKFNSM